MPISRPLNVYHVQLNASLANTLQINAQGAVMDSSCMNKHVYQNVLLLTTLIAHLNVYFASLHVKLVLTRRNACLALRAINILKPHMSVRVLARLALSSTHLLMTVLPAALIALHANLQLFATSAKRAIICMF